MKRIHVAVLWSAAVGVLVLSSLATAVRAHEPAIDFDQGVDVSDVLRTVRERAHASPSGRGPSFRPTYDRTERDCVIISFGRQDPLLSERILLESREYRERCHTYTDGNGNTHRTCHDELVWTERRRVRIRISGRGEMLPWERDAFRVCLDGRWLSARVVDASHEYALDVPGWSSGTIEARAGRKTISLPDPYGIEATLRTDSVSKGFELELKDKWIEYYQGEKIEVQIKLRRYYKNWFDHTILEKKITFEAAETNIIRIADYVSELTGALSPGKPYYVKWKFKRIGSVSKDSWLNYRKTGRTDYKGPRVEPPPDDPEDDW